MIQHEKIFIFEMAKDIALNCKMHWCSKLKEQSVLSLTFFVHNSSVNEHKGMKLKENIWAVLKKWVQNTYHNF